MAESQNVEYKESWRDEYLKWVCGFANAQGGCIYIGLNDNGEVVGLADSKKLLEDIPNKIKDTMGIIADVNCLGENGKQYIEIIVNPSSYPVSYHGEYHYRSGSTKQQLRGSALTEFLVRKTGYRWDSVPIDNVSVGDLDIESFEIFRREAVRTERMTRKDLECTNEELLNKLGSLILIADRVVELIYLKYLKASISYDKEIRVETYPYAREAVREAVYNALIHCKWGDGIPIQIRIEDEFMYISNACVFPSDWTTENLMKTHNSRPYNPDLANTFFRAGYIESWGRGIQKICEECDLIGAKIPEYSVLGDDITVKLTAVSASKVFKRTNNVRKENDMNTKVLELITTQTDISLSEMADRLKVSYKTVQRAVADLKKIGVIERIGGRRKGYWRIKRYDI